MKPVSQEPATGVLWRWDPPGTENLLKSLDLFSSSNTFPLKPMGKLNNILNQMEDDVDIVEHSRPLFRHHILASGCH